MMTAAREILEARIKSRIISSQIQTPSWHWTVGIVLNNYILLFIVERRNVIGQLLTTVHELLWQGSHTRFNWDKRIDKKRHPIWDVITHPCPNIFAKSLRVGAWMDNYIPLFYADVITFPCFNLALLAKGSPEDFAEIESDPGIYTQVSVKFLSVYLNERIHPGDYESRCRLVPFWWFHGIPLLGKHCDLALRRKLSCVRKFWLSYIKSLVLHTYTGCGCCLRQTC